MPTHCFSHLGGCGFIYNDVKSLLFISRRRVKLCNLKGKVVITEAKVASVMVIFTQQAELSAHRADKTLQLFWCQVQLQDSKQLVFTVWRYRVKNPAPITPNALINIWTTVQSRTNKYFLHSGSRWCAHFSFLVHTHCLFPPWCCQTSTKLPDHSQRARVDGWSSLFRPVKPRQIDVYFHQWKLGRMWFDVTISFLWVILSPIIASVL